MVNIWKSNVTAGIPEELVLKYVWFFVKHKILRSVPRVMDIEAVCCFFKFKNCQVDREKKFF